MEENAKILSLEQGNYFFRLISHIEFDIRRIKHEHAGNFQVGTLSYTHLWCHKV